MPQGFFQSYREVDRLVVRRRQFQEDEKAEKYPFYLAVWANGERPPASIGAETCLDLKTLDEVAIFILAILMMREDVRWVVQSRNPVEFGMTSIRHATSQIPSGFQTIQVVTGICGCEDPLAEIHKLLRSLS